MVALIYIGRNWANVQSHVGKMIATARQVVLLADVCTPPHSLGCGPPEARSILGWFGIGLPVARLLPPLAADFIENLISLAGVEFLIEPAQGHANHVAMTDLDARLLPGKLKPELVYPFNVLRPEPSRVLAKDVEPRRRWNPSGGSPA
jgi:hypothetical protein